MRSTLAVGRVKSDHPLGVIPRDRVPGMLGGMVLTHARAAG
jgi:hypothetical protein